jgi:hypothetical protein
LRLPQFVDNRLTDGGEVVSLTRWPAALYPQKDSWYSFLVEAELIPTMILMVFLNIFLLFGELPMEVIPYFITE